MLVVRVINEATNAMSYRALVREEILENVLVADGRMSCDQRQKPVKRSTSMLNKLTICRQNMTCV